MNKEVGWGAVFSAGVQGGISYGAGRIASCYASGIIPLGPVGDIIGVCTIKGGTSGALGAYMAGGDVDKSALSGALWGAASMAISYIDLRYGGGESFNLKLTTE